MPISPIIGGGGRGGGFPHLVSNTTCRRWSIGGGYVAGAESMECKEQD